MTPDLTGKGITQRDVIRQALEPSRLGPDASAQAVREWAEWTFPAVPLDETFAQVVEELRDEVRCHC